MTSYLTFLLALSPAPADAEVHPLAQFVPFVLILVVFYFLIFAPMRKKQRAHSEMLSALKPGDNVITSGGIHGRVTGVTDDAVQLRIAENVKIDVSKNAVAAVRSTGS